MIPAKSYAEKDAKTVAFSGQQKKEHCSCPTSRHRHRAPTQPVLPECISVTPGWIYSNSPTYQHRFSWEFTRINNQRVVMFLHQTMQHMAKFECCQLPSITKCYDHFDYQVKNARVTVDSIQAVWDVLRMLFLLGREENIGHCYAAKWLLKSLTDLPLFFLCSQAEHPDHSHSSGQKVQELCHEE